MTWPSGRYPLAAPSPLESPAPQAAPGTYPVPPGRGQWRLWVLSRMFAYGSSSWGSSVIAELDRARSRRIEQNWNQPATLSFSIDGRSDAAAVITELQTDILAWRWDDQTGADIAVFHGIVTQSEDQLSEQEHTVTFTCKDYGAMLARRLFTTTYSTTQRDQDDIVRDLLARATGASSSSGTSFSPGNYLPLGVVLVNPDGSGRNNSGQLRDRTYPASSEIGQTLDDLSKVIGGFDYDVQPQSLWDRLRIFYPYQGVSRTAPALVYGSTVSALTRSVNSADYANYWRVIGKNGSSDPNAAQLFAEAWNTDANDVTRIPIGLWMGHDDAADVTITSTLTDKAQGDLALSGIVVPTYTLTLRPGAYSWGNPNMGDVVPLVVQAGRLNVNTTVRVLGITYDIGDDGQEDVELIVGRPAVTLPQLLKRPVVDTAALTRR